MCFIDMARKKVTSGKPQGTFFAFVGPIAGMRSQVSTYMLRSSERSGA